MTEELAQEAAAVRSGEPREQAVAVLLTAAATRFPPDHLAVLFTAAARRTTNPMIPGCALAETFLHGAVR